VHTLVCQLCRRFIRKDNYGPVSEDEVSPNAHETNELLPEASFENMTPASVTEHSTRKLDDNLMVSTKAKK
jgi:hypothetical protein